MNYNNSRIFIKRSFVISAIFCLAFKFTTYAQIDTLFWFAGPDVTAQHANSEKYVEIRVTSLATVPVTITLSQPANPTSSINGSLTLAPGAAQLFSMVNFDKSLVESRANGNVLNTGFLISATGPISAYYEVGRSAGRNGDMERNGEIFTLKGNNALGTHFYTPFQNAYANKFDAVSSIDMLATEDNTTITFTLTQPGLSGNRLYNAGTPYQVRLNRGQVYSVKAQSQLAAGHMSGSEVVSDKPIAITQNDDSIESTWTLPKGDGSFETGIDIVGDQLVPANAVGTEYVVVRGFLGTDMAAPSYNRNKVFIVPVQNGTEIRADGATIASRLAAGAVFSYTLPASGSSSILASTITGNKPFYAYYVSGYGAEMGGPLLPPVNCTGSLEVAFVRSSPDPFFVTILTTQDAINSFQVRGRSGIIAASDFVNLNNGWVVAQKRIDSTSMSDYGIPVNQGIVVSNTDNYFHLGIINGTTNGGTSRFAYFSNYTVRNSNGIGCGLVTPISESEILSQRDIVIYSNPFFQTTEVAFKKMHNARLIISAVDGTILEEQSNVNESALIGNFLPAGMYILQIFSQTGEVFTRKISKIY